MPSTRLWRSIWIICIAALILATALAALPMVASTRIVRDRIAQELSAIVGYRVGFASGPDLTIWPVMTARLGDVQFRAWNAAPEEPPVFQADEITLDLSAWSALRGAIRFSKARAVRPLLRVTPEGDLALPAAPRIPGRVGYAVGFARRAIDANPQAPNFSDLPQDTLGTIEFSEGRVIVRDATGERDAITAGNGRIEWPALHQPMIANVSGIWRGEPITVSVTAPQPLVMLAGGASKIAATFKSAPLEASFDGSASAGGDGFADGTLRLASPSLRRLLEWSQSPMSIGAASAAIEASSSVNGSGERLKLDNTELTIDGNRGVGALEVSTAQPVPRVAGTLAFGGLDLGAFLSAFTPLRAADPARQGGVDAGFGRHVDLDLRLSASRATAGKVSLENVAATAQVKDRLAVLDVSDASAFGGTVQAGIRVERRWDTNEAEIKLTADNIDAASAAGALGFGPLVPRARSQLSLVLKGTGRDWPSVFETASGAISAKLGQGTVEGVDLGAFMSLVGKGNFFPLSDMPPGSLPISGAEFKAVVQTGVARVEQASIRTNDRTINVGGIVPYVGRGLALQGSIALNNAGAAPDTQGQTSQGQAGQTIQSPVRFFVGGTWASPFVSPVYSSWPAQ